jgi:hypothetical protein
MEENKILEGASEEAMERLVKVLTDAPTLVKLANAGWEITALKPAVQWEIAKVGCEIAKLEHGTFGDVLASFSGQLPSVVKVVTLALLNDKERIQNEYQRVYETLWWESKPEEWATLLFEIYQMLDVSFFMTCKEAIEVLKTMTLQKRKIAEQK